MNIWKLIILLACMTTLCGFDGCGGSTGGDEGYDYSQDNSENQQFQED